MNACQPARRRRRRALATRDVFVCLPVLALIALATIEASAMLFVQQSLSIAAYEGARIALAPGADSAQVEQQCQMILANREVRDATIVVRPIGSPEQDVGSWVEVEASAPFSSNSLVGGWLFGRRTLTAAAQLLREN